MSEERRRRKGNIKEEKMKLNLGCGTDYKEGWMNTDIDESVKINTK